MTPNRIAVLVASLFAFSAAGVLAHGDDPKTKKQKLGTVQFKTSCSPQAQKEFEVALARLHSFDFPETITAFTAIPQTDPTCAIAYWGLAVAIRPNTLVWTWDAATLM